MKKTGFVSEIDRFLTQFDQTHPEKSTSQQAEIDKFKPIAEKRDKNINASQPESSTLWEGF